MLRSKWDLRFLFLCKVIGNWSKDPRRKVGSVIVREDKTIVSLGFNGFPHGVVDYEERYNDRKIKLDMIVHAEANAILKASSENLKNCILYSYPLFPCNECTKMIIQTGIKQVVSISPDSNDNYWMEKFMISKTMMDEAGVSVYEYDIKFINELFKQQIQDLLISIEDFNQGGN